MKSILKKFITFLYSSFKFHRNSNNNLRILMYHSIRSGNYPKDLWNLDVDLFSKHLSYLNENQDLKIYSCKELVKDIPKDGIMITFDDGYLDNFEIASPLLLSLNIPFTLFVVTDHIKKRKKNYMTSEMLKRYESLNVSQWRLEGF